MSTLSVRRPTPMATSLALSVGLHGLAIVAVLVVRPEPPPPMPPVYKVELIAAPAGPRAIGAVDPVREASTPTPPPARAEQKAAMPVPTTQKAPPPRSATRATPTPPRAAQRTDRAQEQVRAGGGTVGGQGTDVANVRIDGIAFPFPAYLNNVVRQIALHFNPPARSVLSADIAFLIHRDGRVSDVRLVKRSGSYAFDTEAMGALEAAGKQFGPLPDGFADDVLPIVFSFDPKLIR